MELRSRRKTASAECHGWAITYKLRTNGGSGIGDIMIVCPWDGTKVASIPALRRKLGLEGQGLEAGHGGGGCSAPHSGAEGFLFPFLLPKKLSN